MNKTIKTFRRYDGSSVRVIRSGLLTDESTFIVKMKCDDGYKREVECGSNFSKAMEIFNNWKNWLR